MTIGTLPFERRPRNSIANNLDRINKLIEWVNQDTHLYASASGERVTVDDASSLKGLTIDGRSLQDGTPTPDAPVPVRVVQGRNLANPTIDSATSLGLTITKLNDNSFKISGTSTTNSLPSAKMTSCGVLPAGNYTATLKIINGSVTGSDGIRCRIGKGSSTTYVTGSSYTSSGDSSITFTADGTSEYFAAVQAAAADTVVDCVIGLQIEESSTATPYTPYGSIGIVVGNTATPIDLQGNTLASLPDGTRDELHVDSAGHVWIDKRVRHTTQAVTDGVTGTVGTDVLSSTGQIADGADVWYKLATPQTINLGYITTPAIPSGSVVTISASLTPTFNLEWWVDDGITTLVNDLITYVDYKTEG